MSYSGYAFFLSVSDNYFRNYLMAQNSISTVCYRFYCKTFAIVSKMKCSLIQVFHISHVHIWTAASSVISESECIRLLSQTRAGLAG